LRGETHLVPKNDDWKQAHLAMRWSGSASAPGCTAIDCRHSVMIEPHELARQSPARHADSAAHDLKGNALHMLRGAEGMLRCCWPEPHNTRPEPEKKMPGDGRRLWWRA